MTSGFDSQGPSVFAALKGTEKARLVLSDVPFNVPIAGHVSGWKGVREFAMASGEMTKTEFIRFPTAVVSIDGSLALDFIDWRHIEAMMAAGRAVSADPKNVICWTTSNAGMGQGLGDRSPAEYLASIRSEAPASQMC